MIHTDRVSDQDRLVRSFAAIFETQCLLETTKDRLWPKFRGGVAPPAQKKRR